MLFDLDFTTEPEVARLQLTLFASPKKVSKERRPAQLANTAPLRGSQHFGKASGHENNSAGGDVLQPAEATSRQPQTIFVETPDPFPKCWRGNTGILECGGLYSRRIFNLFCFNSPLLIAQTVGWAGLICPRARRGSSVGTRCFAHPTFLSLSPQRPTQKQEGPVRTMNPDRPFFWRSRITSRRATPGSVNESPMANTCGANRFVQCALRATSPAGF
jgi:hypothetical protein